MSELKGSNTEENLLKSFALESQTRNRYDYFAEQAEEEGYTEIAGVFKTTAQNEREHAKIFFSYLEGGSEEITATFPAGKIGTTEENLISAVNGENRENEELYPKFAEVAEEEGFAEIAESFRNIARIERGHEARYRALLDRIQEMKEVEEVDEEVWECSKCGYIYTGDEPPETCPVCDHSQHYFHRSTKFLQSYFVAGSGDHDKNYTAKQKVDHGKTYHPKNKNERKASDCYTGCKV